MSSTLATMDKQRVHGHPSDQLQKESKKPRGDPEALAATLKASTDWEERIAAAEGIGKLCSAAGEVGARALLAAMEGDPNLQHRYGETVEERAAANTASFVRQAAATALGKLDTAATPFVIAAIRSSGLYPDLVTGAYRIPMPAAATRDPEVQMAMAESLRALGAAALPPLAAALADGDAATRKQVAMIMGQMGAVAAPQVGLLARTLQNDAEADVRKAAAVALGLLGPAAALGADALALTMVSDADENVRFRSVSALSQLGEEAGTGRFWEGSGRVGPRGVLAGAGARGWGQGLGPGAGTQLPHPSWCLCSRPARQCRPQRHTRRPSDRWRSSPACGRCARACP